MVTFNVSGIVLTPWRAGCAGTENHNILLYVSSAPPDSSQFIMGKPCEYNITEGYVYVCGIMKLRRTTIILCAWMKGEILPRKKRSCSCNDLRRLINLTMLHLLSVTLCHGTSDYSLVSEELIRRVSHPYRRF